jgi:hypothetical protein
MRRLKIMVSHQQQHFTLLPVGSQQLHVAFEGERIVSDAELLAVRALEKPLRVIADLAQRLPIPAHRSTSNTPPKPFSPKKRRRVRDWWILLDGVSPNVCHAGDAARVTGNGGRRRELVGTAIASKICEPRSLFFPFSFLVPRGRKRRPRREPGRA